MRSIVEFIKENILSESNNSTKYNFNPKDESELYELLTIEDYDNEKIDEFKIEWYKWCKQHKIDETSVYDLPFGDIWLGIKGAIGFMLRDESRNKKDKGINWWEIAKLDEPKNGYGYCVSARGGNLRLDYYKSSSHSAVKIEDTIRSIKYNFTVSFFENFAKLVFNI